MSASKSFRYHSKISFLCRVRSLVVTSLLWCLVSCGQVASADEAAGILVSGSQMQLWDLQLDEAEKLVGKPERTEFHENGGEDFAWNNFEVRSYRSDSIRLHIDAATHRVIRISVRLDLNPDVRTAPGITSQMTLGEVKVVASKVGIQETFADEKYFSGTLESKLNRAPILFSVWFGEQGTVTWYDLYYEKPWKP